ncbi:Tim44 domain-containing protein [uncultured Desulfovibrio sp.]|uniref:Tim44 domain-containing protein n=1 Tax=uncultured Desulfovibrio sp. TaxID=167968 RepID=UPI0026384471|nr:Tim44-like domain-containing protein [uncultured Desulfovibrio sp.]
MKASAILTGIFLLFSTIVLALPESVEAARMGGGRSFGSKPFMSKPAPAPAMRQQTPGAQRQPMNQAQAAQAAKRPGLFGGMGGLFGGLLAGTLLGSLLAGNGFSGGGFMDIILIGLLVFLGFKLFARFRNRQAPVPAGAGAQGGMSGLHSDLREDSASQGMRRDSAAPGWDMLRDTGRGGVDQEQNPEAAPRVDVPEGFDVDEFLRGAKMAYNIMQQAWDKRDLNDIAQFATPAVMDAIREQMAAEPTPSTTEVLLVNAQLLDVENDGDSQRAQVFFDVLMRERPDQQAPSSVREIWHFVRPSAEGTWKLDGIQQVE